MVMTPPVDVKNHIGKVSVSVHPSQRPTKCDVHVVSTWRGKIVLGNRTVSWERVGKKGWVARVVLVEEETKKREDREGG